MQNRARTHLVALVAFMGGWLGAAWVPGDDESAPLMSAEPTSSCVRRVTRWEHCGTSASPSESDRLLEPTPRYPPSTTEALEECAIRSGHLVLSDCDEWPCIVAIAYADKESYRAGQCRDRLEPAELPMKTSMLRVGNTEVYLRKFWLADISVIDQWSDQGPRSCFRP